MGPILIFDKSTLQSLNMDESVWLEQHAPGSIWQRLVHPGGSGGYSEWAIPRGAPR